MDDDVAISVRNVLRPAAGPAEAGFFVGPEIGETSEVSETSEVWNLRKHVLGCFIKEMRDDFHSSRLS